MEIPTCLKPSKGNFATNAANALTLAPKKRFTVPLKNLLFQEFIFVFIIICVTIAMSARTLAPMRPSGIGTADNYFQIYHVRRKTHALRSRIKEMRSLS